MSAKKWIAVVALEMPLAVRGIIGLIGDAQVVRELVTEGTWTHDLLVNFLRAESFWWVVALLGLVLASWATDWWPLRLLRHNETTRPVPPVRLEEEIVPIEEAARWLYSEGNEHVRLLLREGVPSLWPSIPEAGRSYIINAAGPVGYPVYIQRDDGLPWEPLENPDEADDFGDFESIFSKDERERKPLAVRRSDLSRIKEHYERNE
jgi:hypothetical protein